MIKINWLNLRYRITHVCYWRRFKARRHLKKGRPDYGLLREKQKEGHRGH